MTDNRSPNIIISSRPVFFFLIVDDKSSKHEINFINERASMVVVSGVCTDVCTYKLFFHAICFIASYRKSMVTVSILLKPIIYTNTVGL